MYDTGNIPLEKLIAEGYRPKHDDILDEDILLAPPVELEFVRHPKAPMFDDPIKGRAIINKLLTDMASDDFVFTNDVLEIYRQASLVSLWFFLKFVCGYAGPYADLNDSLHISMCNYRQRMTHPAARGAFFIPRSCFKSTIGTHGANAWEIIRDPNIRIGMISSTKEMAEMFMYATMHIFDSNSLMRILFPECCPEVNEDGKVLNGIDWTRTSFTCPARTKTFPEPTMKCAGVNGSPQGIHADLLSIDDVVGEKQMNAFHEVGDEMIKIANWLDSNTETLLISPKYSRVFLAATRYSINDPYEQIMCNAKEHIGCWDDSPYEINPDGVWTVYYRQAVERGRLIFPEKIDFKFLRRLKKTNYWSYITQYMNNAHGAEISEFSKYSIKDATIDYLNGQFFVTYQKEGKPFTQPLQNCEVTIGIDPGASSSRSSAKTSRTAMVVRARDAFDNRIYIDGAVGYMTTVEFYDNIFRLYKKYKGYLSGVFFEAGGPFKFIYDTIVEEQKKRHCYIGLRKLLPLPGKDDKIRNFIQPLLEFGQVYACKPIDEYVRDEITTFPGGNLKDTLDAMELADRMSIKPKTTEEKRLEEETNSYRDRVRNRTGY